MLPVCDLRDGLGGAFSREGRRLARRALRRDSLGNGDRLDSIAIGLLISDGRNHGDHVPFAYLADGPTRGFAARGRLGHLVVFPAERVVAVRMRRLGSNDRQDGPESSGWHGSADDVARLVGMVDKAP
jgi:hypothetical protein